MTADFDTDQGSVTEIAAEYGMTPAAVRAWIYRGFIDGELQRNKLMVSRQQVAQMVAKHPRRGKPRTARGKELLARAAATPTPAPPTESWLSSRRGPDHYSLVEELGLDE